MCETKYCNNKPKRGRFCNTCNSRRKWDRNPVRYAYDTLKANVYRRKGRAFFYLTFDEFKQYAYETNYITGKGKSAASWSIDCKDPTMGYFIGNIQPLTLSANSVKSNKVLQYDWQTGFATVTRKDKTNNDDNPF